VYPIEGGGSILDPREPELGVAYPLDEVRAVLAEAGLELSEPVRHGLWANAPGGLTLQDIVVARRSGN
jgi:hypothetical protein